MTPRPLTLALLLLACSPSPSPDERPGDEGVELWTFNPAPAPERVPCTEERTHAILATPSDGNTALVDCNLTLAPTDRVTRALVLRGEESSGVTVDCQGATIAAPEGDSLRLRAHEGWPVHDVTIRDCFIEGSIRIWGLALNGQGEALLESSHELEHVARVRDAAPYRIVLEGVEVIPSSGRIPLYLGPGTHHVTLENSVIRGGRSDSVMVYLDAETTANTIRGNRIDANHASREAIALDGSSENRIENNTLLNVWDGGIFLYRNCGEGSVVRHATPSGNAIRENTISCRGTVTDPIIQPGIFIGSRGGRQGYCNQDAGHPYGSSQSDFDHARWNQVQGNVLQRCGIEVGDSTNQENSISEN